jgi:hypothetical protein
MKRKHSEINESFTYKVSDYDHKEKIYTLKNKITGRVIKMAKEDFEARLREQKNG